MGATVGAAALAGGARVLWARADRSEATRTRADRAKLEGVNDTAELFAASDAVLCVCPPDAALAVARSAAAAGFSGLYVDANAIAPATAREVEGIVTAAGAGFVDGGLIGPPAHRPGTTRLHLSGERAAEVAAWFAEGPLAAHVVAGPAGAASALKMAFAAYTKGVTALLSGILALAEHEGVRDPLLEEWRTALPDLPARATASLPAGAQKAWRFEGEMREIAATFAAAGLPDGFHRAAAELYGRLSEFRDADPPPDIEEIIRRLLAAERGEVG
jgi:3-hydroxyisobutyrate dehydrogenase-like beta-hydroxyacid dehydrogenase